MKQLVTIRFCNRTVQRDVAAVSKFTPKMVIVAPVDPNDGTTKCTWDRSAPYDPYCFLVSFNDEHVKDAAATISPNCKPPLEFLSHSGGFGAIKRPSPAIPRPGYPQQKDKPPELIPHVILEPALIDIHPSESEL